MAAAVPQYDFTTCPVAWPVKPTNPTDPAIDEGAHVGDNVFGIVYATVESDATLAHLLLSGGYGRIVPAAAATGNAITQGEKIYMVDSTGTTRPAYTNDSSGNTFAGYALPANLTAAANNTLVAAAGTGDIMLWVRPE